MEFKLDSYRRQNGNIFTTPDGHKYIKSKIREGKAYLKCVLYRNGCKATAKLNLLTSLIIPGANHNHNIQEYLSQTSTIQFDGTFYTVPIQFYQLWTVFLTFDRHTLPVIHCLMTGKDEELYEAIMINIRSLLPELNPTSSMSDWESAPRNALKIVYPNTLILGCWFHFTQRIWSEVQKFGLVKTFKENNEFASYIRKLMSVPFLPASLIQPTYSFLQLPTNLIASETVKLERISKYFKKRWLTQIRPEELSIFDSDFSTNNGAESYHSRLKARIKTNHPRIWNFMHILNAIIMDTDNELGRLSLGKETTRPRKRTKVAEIITIVLFV